MIKYCTLYAMTIGIIAPIGYVICAIIQNKWRKMIDPKANGRPRTRSIGKAPIVPAEGHTEHHDSCPCGTEGNIEYSHPIPIRKHRWEVVDGKAWCVHGGS
jgi:hypothetical protein